MVVEIVPPELGGLNSVCYQFDPAAEFTPCCVHRDNKSMNFIGNEVCVFKVGVQGVQHALKFCFMLRSYAIGDAGIFFVPLFLQFVE
jgi:hypothetical protein